MTFIPQQVFFLTENNAFIFIFTKMNWQLGPPEYYKNIDMSILKQSDKKFTRVLLVGYTSFNNKKNTFILDTII